MLWFSHCQGPVFRYVASILDGKSWYDRWLFLFLKREQRHILFFFFLRSCHSRGIFINRPECSYGAIPCCSLELKNEVFTQGGNELIKIVNV